MIAAGEGDCGDATSEEAPYPKQNGTERASPRLRVRIEMPHTHLPGYHQEKNERAPTIDSFGIGAFVILRTRSLFAVYHI
jgi:hypothetical protein